MALTERRWLFLRQVTCKKGIGNKFAVFAGNNYLTVIYSRQRSSGENIRIMVTLPSVPRFAVAKLFISRDQAEEAMAYQVILLCDLDHNVFTI